jgi:glycosyltransferase involved in cell wall biosynthesis
VSGLKSILVIGKVWPESTSSAAGSRMMQLLHHFKAKDWNVEFATAASDSAFADDLKSAGIQSATIQLNNSSFDDYVKSLQPNVVLFDRFMTEEQFGWRVAENSPKSIRILDTEDLHCLREGRRLALKNGRAFTLNDVNNEVAKREIGSLLRCDLSLIISEVERVLLLDHFNLKEELLCYIPLLAPNFSVRETPQYIERKHFISIGNFLHEPNWDATLYLKNEIWPIIRSKLPAAEMHVYGAYPSQKVFQLHDEKSGFLIKGRANDAGAVLGKARVLLAPLRFGAGQKGKLLEAMCNGTPSVTTPIGAESMFEEKECPGRISTSANDFSEAAINLYTNETSWNVAQSKIASIIQERFNPEKFLPVLDSRIEYLLNHLENHRSRNFMASILLHHQLSSTKYMSKWIEEKNKPK